MSSNFSSDDINAIRDLYVQAGIDHKKTDVFLDAVKNFQRSSALLEAYHGTALAMKANITIDNFDKFNTITRSREKLEMAVKLDKNNIEIRFLRFMVQSKIPKFINYNNIGEDKNLIFKNLSEINKIENPIYVDIIFDCLIKSTHFTNTEKAIIKVYKDKKPE